MLSKKNNAHIKKMHIKYLKEHFKRDLSKKTIQNDNKIMLYKIRKLLNEYNSKGKLLNIKQTNSNIGNYK